MRRSRFSSDFILRSVDPRKFLQVVNVFRNKTLVPCAFSCKTIIKKEKEKGMKRTAQSVKAFKTFFVWKYHSRLQSLRLWARWANALFKREKEGIEIGSISSQDTFSQPCFIFFWAARVIPFSNEKSVSRLGYTLWPTNSNQLNFVGAVNYDSVKRVVEQNLDLKRETFKLKWQVIMGSRPPST